MIAEIEEYIELISMDHSPNTIRLYKNAISKLLEKLSIQNFDQILALKPVDIRKYQNILLKEMCASSVNSNIRPLKAMFNWMVENEMISKSPLKGIKELKTSKKEPIFLTDEEQEKIVGACKTKEELLIVGILISTGIRRDELCKITKKDYNGTHILVHGKGNKERTLALQDEVITLLEDYLASRKDNCEALIVSRLKKPFRGGGIYKKVKSILGKAGIDEDRMEKITPHKLRHTFVANMLDNGADIYTCQMGLGHSSIKTTMRYAHLKNSTLDRFLKSQKPILGVKNVS